MPPVAQRLSELGGRRHGLVEDSKTVAPEPSLDHYNCGQLSVLARSQVIDRQSPAA
jgi:hypothetical protein